VLITADYFFCRRQTQQEIDMVFEENTYMTAFEIKWNAKAKSKFNQLFLETCKPKETLVIHPENYMDYLYSGQCILYLGCDKIAMVQLLAC
jgi:uncharacterized protein